MLGECCVALALGALLIESIHPVVVRAAELPTTAPIGVPERPVPDEAKMWSVKPLRRPEPPRPTNAAWVKNPIDAFILTRLEATGLKPNPPADRVALIRRATYDLTGLPPTPAEVDAFVADTAANAYPKVIDRLLASPHYGEQWARHWLDLVRYGETNSYERDNPKPHVWRYRDYVVRSFNQDKPYDRFVREQIAGDEIPDGGADGLIATGYYRLGIWDDEPSDREQARYDELDDIVSTTGQVFLGLTVGCGRCHDHKIDPFPQKDYYRLLAFFQNIRPYQNDGINIEAPIMADANARGAAERVARERDDRRKVIHGLIDQAENDFFQLVSGDPAREVVKKAAVPKLIEKEGVRVLGAQRFGEYRKLKQELADLHKPPNGAEMALCVSENGPTPPVTFVLMRGSAHNQGDQVEPDFPRIFHRLPAQMPKPPAGGKTSGRRTVLADWITARDNPITARVMANRLWQFHFGRGIVRSSSNFGLGGDAPTHPELLDWLASEFMERGWSIKAMHRLIMTSSAYQMSSRGDEHALAVDPLNDLFWRFDMRRLSAEEVRDSILAVNGTLNPAMGGPSVFVHLPAAVLATESHPGANWGTSSPEDQCRRSIYIHVKRSVSVPILESFDAADTDNSCPARFVTVQPTQALGLLNGEFANTEAAKFSARARSEAGPDPAAQVRFILRLATDRTPSEAEVKKGLDLIESLKKKGATDAVATNDFALMSLSLNEFVYLD